MYCTSVAFLVFFLLFLPSRGSCNHSERHYILYKNCRCFYSEKGWSPVETLKPFLFRRASHFLKLYTLTFKNAKEGAGEVIRHSLLRKAYFRKVRKIVDKNMQQGELMTFVLGVRRLEDLGGCIFRHFLGHNHPTLPTGLPYPTLPTGLSENSG